jgi:hypothetical protein
VEWVLLEVKAEGLEGLAVLAWSLPPGEWVLLLHWPAPPAPFLSPSSFSDLSLALPVVS